MSLNVRIKAAQGVALTLFETEQLLDQLIGNTGKLATTMTTARIESHYGCEVGHSALLRLGDAMSSLIDARGAMIDIHKELAHVGQEFDIPFRAFGAPYGKPKPNVGLTVVDPASSEAA